MNIGRVAFGLGIVAGLEMGCRASSAAPQPLDLLCRPSDALLRATPSLPVAKCFSLFEAYRGQTACTQALPFTVREEAYSEYFDCLTSVRPDASPEDGLSALEKGVLASLPKEVSGQGLDGRVRERIFKQHPDVGVAARMAAAKTGKNPNPEPKLADLPIADNVLYGAYAYFRQTEEDGVRWKKGGVLEYWNAKGDHWIKTAECPTGVIGKCNTYNVAGNDAPDDRTFILGTDVGTVHVQYTTFRIPDQISLSCDGKALWSSGCVGTGFDGMNIMAKPRSASSGPIKLDCPSGFLNVHVAPNCDGDIGTAWKYLVTCPK